MKKLVLWLMAILPLQGIPLAAGPCVYSIPAVCTITIAVDTTHCSSGICNMSPIGDASVASGVRVEWDLAASLQGAVYAVFLPDPMNKAFPRSIYKSVPGNGDGDVATAPPLNTYTAEYLLFWKYGNLQAFLDPRVVVTGNGVATGDTLIK
jgi:hypothetical protein